MGNIPTNREDEESNDLLLDVDEDRACCFPTKIKSHNIVTQMKSMDDSIKILDAKIEFLKHNAAEQRVACFKLMGEKKRDQARRFLVLSKINQKHASKFEDMRLTLETMRIELSSAHTTHMVAKTIVGGGQLMDKINERIECLEVHDLLAKFREDAGQIADVQNVLSDFQETYYAQCSFDEDEIIEELNALENIVSKPYNENGELMKSKDSIMMSPRKNIETPRKIALQF